MTLVALYRLNMINMLISLVLAFLTITFLFKISWIQVCQLGCQTSTMRGNTFANMVEVYERASNSLGVLLILLFTSMTLGFSNICRLPFINIFLCSFKNYESQLGFFVVFAIIWEKKTPKDFEYNRMGEKNGITVTKETCEEDKWWNSVYAVTIHEWWNKSIEGGIDVFIKIGHWDVN